MIVGSVLSVAPAWILVSVALAAAWRITRGGGGGAVAELTAANKVLEDSLRKERQATHIRVDELGGEVRDLRVENSALRERTDFYGVMQAHELNAQERSVKMLAVLDLIASRLGPDLEEAAV
ncbi:MAG TPA: hypothetical protein VFG23_12355 [Polyangia bacterium]|nr:hypothetical protein [Polyangia bacterium]